MNRWVRSVFCLLAAASGAMAFASPASAQEQRKPPAWYLRKPDIQVPALRPLQFDGKPFFPIGAYGLPGGMTLKDVVEKGGWTAVQLHLTDDRLKDGMTRVSIPLKGWSEPVANDKLWDLKNEAYADLLKQADAENIAVQIYAVDLMTSGKYGQREEFEKRLKRLMGYKSFWGFYGMDEPENVWWSYPVKEGDLDEYMKEHHLDPDNKEARMDALVDCIRDRIGWARSAFRAVDHRADNYLFWCIGWQDQYFKLQPLCDVNMPNEYPAWYPREQKPTPAITGGELPAVLSDARQAAAAAYVNGKLGFVYTPLGISSYTGLKETDGGSVPQEVLRYTFFAPITQGAMGVMSWAGYRCSREYAENTLFPVTRQLKALSPFFLGRWLNEDVTWTPTDEESDLLHKYDAPRIAACLRRAEDGRYLLLAVNNGDTAADAAFTLHLPGLSGMKAHEFFTDKDAGISADGVIKDSIGAYDVRGYILTPEK